MTDIRPVLRHDDGTASTMHQDVAPLIGRAYRIPPWSQPHGGKVVRIIGQDQLFPGEPRGFVDCEGARWGCDVALLRRALESYAIDDDAPIDEETGS